MILPWSVLVVFSLVLQGVLPKRAGCGVSRKAARPQVMGGKTSTKGMWPWMVALTIKNDKGKETEHCSAFLISKRHVLTAAHCFEPIDPSVYGVKIGNVNWRRGRRYAIHRIAIHIEYRKGFHYNDIALITLDKDVRDPRVRPICLPNSQLASTTLDGQKTTVAGWGMIKPDGKPSKRLQHLSGMKVFSNSECTKILVKLVGMYDFHLEFPKDISEDFICAGFLEGGKDSCQGDSGGPLMLKYNGRWTAVGIVSFGYGCGLADYPGGYTRISTFHSWIKKQMSS